MKKTKEKKPGERFEGVKKLLALYGFKTLKVTSKLVCNALGCGKKLPIHGKDENGKPVSRSRWCEMHRKMADGVRNMHSTRLSRGIKPGKAPKHTYAVRGGHLTLLAALSGVNEEKALEKYKEGKRGRRWFKAPTKVQKGRKAAKKVAKKLVAAAKKVAVVKAAPRPTPKKVPAKKVAPVSLKALVNGKGDGVQAAVAAHVAAKAAAK